MLEQHCGMRMTRRWRSLAAALPVSDEMGPEELFGGESSRVKTFRCPGETLIFSENSLQGKEGIFRPLSLLVGATRGSGGVSRVSSGGRWQGVCCLRSLLQELIKLWEKQIDLSQSHVQLKAYQCHIDELVEGRKILKPPHTLKLVEHMQLFTIIVIRVCTFTGHPFLGGIPFLLRRKKS